MKIKNCLKKVILFFINHFMVGNYLWEIKNILLRFAGISIGHNVKIVGPIKIDVCSNLSIGNNCWIGKNLNIIGNADVIIGDYCDFAPDVFLETGTHEIGNTERRAGRGYCESIHIGSGCWIGIRTTILPGVKIGNGCVVAAGAVVNKSVRENVLIGGVPAKIIKVL